MASKARNISRAGVLALTLSIVAGGAFSAPRTTALRPLAGLPPPAGLLVKTAASAPGAHPASTLAPAQKRQLDDLFRRLALASDATEANGIAEAIRRVWLHSGSDTADLLMSRANTAMGNQKMDLAETLLDHVIKLEPDWAESWNRRATVRFHRDDDNGAMADIAQVLLREPRHFGALSGMGFVLQRHNMPQAALKVFRRVLELNPQQDDIKKIISKLTVDVEGREI